MKTKIFICGGHITPAIAVMDLLKKDPSVELVFIGPIEERYGVRSLALTAGRFTRVFSLSSIISFLKIPIGFIQAFMYCLKERPTLVVSFGGYIALPVALSAWVLRIPVLTHEQTRMTGLTNRILAGVARRICVTFEDTVGQFPKSKVVITGLPMRGALFTPNTKVPYAVDEKKYPILYVTGGSLGAQSLNRMIYPIISELTKRWTVIHQVGANSITEAKKIQDPRYIAEETVSTQNVSWILAHAGLVVGRSGANTVIELAALGKVAVLVPLPWASMDEQRLNAEWLAKHGGAVVLGQNTLTPEKLLTAITAAWDSRAVYQKRASTLAPTIPRDGDAKVVEEIKKVLPYQL